MIGCMSHSGLGKAHDLLKLVQVLEACQDDLLAGLGDLSRQKDFVEDGVDLSNTSFV